MNGLDKPTVMTALITASAGPLLSKYAIILLAAILGAVITLSRQPSGGTWNGIKQVFRSVCFATVLTSLGAVALSSVISAFTPIHIAAEEFIFPLAFLIALIGDDWLKLKDWGLERVGMLIRGSKHD